MNPFYHKPKSLLTNRVKIVQHTLRKGLFLFLPLALFLSCNKNIEENIGKTTITKWQGDKQSAISLTYDDGIITQLTVARPIMNKLGFPATFFILTEKVKGASAGKFIGRDPEAIIQETATIPTNEANFFERASLIGFTGTPKALVYHSDAGAVFESGKIKEAYALLDEGYEQVRNGTLKNDAETVYHNNPIDTTSWEDYKAYAAEGHEIASHTITHPRLAVLNEVNLLYELEQSKADIATFLGKKYTFSAECPYGTEDERVMEYAQQIYPALRNRMPEIYLDELNRSSDLQPGASQKEYVQWQRGPLTDTSMDQMKSWVDTCLTKDNIWLVLVFHGVDGIGWEPKTGAELEEYFEYIKKRESLVWVATFGDVTKYIRERKNIQLEPKVSDAAIAIQLTSTLDSAMYDVPITLKTYVPKKWKGASLVTSGNEKDTVSLRLQEDELGFYVLYTIAPSAKEIVLSEKIG